MDGIDIHADDFGESLHTSEDILECLEAGKLESISVLSNMACFEKCVARYREAQGGFAKEPKLSVHLNFIEGRCLSAPARIPALVDADGYFTASWGKLFLRSWLPGRKRLKGQLKEEIILQTDAFRHAFPEITEMRFDSHQHVHMIPVVAEALFEVIAEKGWQVEYIRNAKEPLFPFFRELSLYRTYRPVNFVKNIILNFCALLMEGHLKRMDLVPMYTWGLVMSGHMDLERVEKLLPAMRKKAQRNGRMLEILFHPGQLLQKELTPELKQKDGISFYVSEDRRVEKSAVMRLEL